MVLNMINTQIDVVHVPLGCKGIVDSWMRDNKGNNRCKRCDAQQPAKCREVIRVVI